MKQNRNILLYKKWNFLIYSLLLCSSISFALDFYYPLFSVRKIWIFSNTVTLASSISALFHEKDYLLAAVVTIFAIIFPAVKLLSLWWLWTFSSTHKLKAHLGWISTLSKWAMLDVFMVALMIVAFKLSSMIKISISTGMVFIIITVILSKLTAYIIDKIVQRPMQS